MAVRIGLGSDLHRLKPGDGIRLGGLDIPCSLSCIAVSDGDVLLHALIDAWLGALGLGDIGDHFPESSVVPGTDSRFFLEKILTLSSREKARIVNIDCIIELERPKLGEWKKKIGANLADLLELAPAKINVKAKTAEGMGQVGNGLVIIARTVLLVEVDA
ncbi:MAG: 2-C-methyl-D-erythritol 2,4-cyclodiphosphate synthase [Planctomycetes bacterium]|nr:2-C-methyl-D-erythritol 2,4-cyclodiphosphate synthase [Planctomycetota bacterium]